MVSRLCRVWKLQNTEIFVEEFKENDTYIGKYMFFTHPYDECFNIQKNDISLFNHNYCIA